MKNIIIAMLVTLTAFAANAGWDVRTYHSGMTDKLNGHALQFQNAEGGIISFNCMFDGTESIAVAAPEYIGFSPMKKTVFAVDGEVFFSTPFAKKVRPTSFLSVTSVNMDLVAAMSQGKELRFMQHATYKDSNVYYVPLDGFVKGYQEWGKRCSEFY